MNKTILTILVIFLSGLGSITAQDLIYKKNKEVIECKIISVKTKIISYRQLKYNTGTVFTIDKADVIKIVYESGEEIIFPTVAYHPSTPVYVSEKDHVDYNLQRKSIIKFEFFGPLTGNLTLGYEHSLGLQRSVEMSVGIIGIGSKWITGASGGFFRIGFKAIRSPEVYVNAGHSSHILKGSFIRPDVMFSYFTYDGSNSYGTTHKIREEAFSVAFLINLGKQWVLSNSYSFSWSIGVGYAYSSNTSNTYSSEGYYFSHITGGNNFPIAASLSLNVGLLP